MWASKKTWIRFSRGPRRWLSEQNNEPRLVYEGGFDNMLRKLKRVSLFSCTCTLIGVPFLAISSENPRMNKIQKWVVAFVVIVFGVSTTVALHVVAKPYVSKIFLLGRNEMRLETMNLLGRPKQFVMNMNDVVRSEKPWATFTARHDSNKSFFVEEVEESYRDKIFRSELFSKLGKPSTN